MQKKTIARAITTATLALALAAAAPLAASAHVPVSPNRAAAGSTSLLTFKVPTESATANTVKLEIDFPTDTPFGSVSYQPVAGWTADVVTSTLATPVKTDDGTITEAPTKVTYTADANSAIAPGQFQQFVISAGPVPDTGSVMFLVHQTYSDGTVVDWVDPTPASGVEPEHPAPTLYINDAPPVDAAAGASATVSATPAAGSGGSDSTTTSSSPTSADVVALSVGIAGLALAAIALVVAVLAVTRTRRTVAAAANAAPRAATAPGAGAPGATAAPIDAPATPNKTGEQSPEPGSGTPAGPNGE